MRQFKVLLRPSRVRLDARRSNILDSNDFKAAGESSPLLLWHCAGRPRLTAKTPCILSLHCTHCHREQQLPHNDAG